MNENSNLQKKVKVQRGFSPIKEVKQMLSMGKPNFDL